MVGVGIAWAVFYLSYAMLSGSLPSDKMGYYMEFSTLYSNPVTAHAQRSTDTLSRSDNG
jgi:hypothetical protein